MQTTKQIFATATEITKRRPLLIAAISGVVAVLFAWGYLSGVKDQILSTKEPVAVVLAAVDIKKGEAIDEGALKIERIPKSFIQPQAFFAIKEAAGRIAVAPMLAGTQVTLALARRADDTTGISAVIPAGKRAVAIAVDEATGLAGFLKPGDMVDVLGTFDLGGEAGLLKRTTLTIVENVQVLAVGGELIDSQFRAVKKKKKDGIFDHTNGDQIARAQMTVTLAVTPIDAGKIILAKDSGLVALAQRPFGEEGTAERTEPVTISHITGGFDDLMPIKRGFKEYRGR